MTTVITNNNDKKSFETVAIVAGSVLLAAATPGNTVVVPKPHTSGTKPALTRTIEARPIITPSVSSAQIIGNLSVYNAKRPTKVNDNIEKPRELKMVSKSNEKLSSKSSQLERSATYAGISIVFLVISMFFFALLTSINYALFFIPPLLAASGIAISNGIQLNKIDRLLKS